VCRVSYRGVKNPIKNISPPLPNQDQNRAITIRDTLKWVVITVARIKPRVVQTYSSPSSPKK